MEDDRYPEKPKDEFPAWLIDKEPSGYDPEYEKAIDSLEEIKEHIDKTKGMSKEDKDAYWDDQINKIMMAWPKNPYGPCKDPEDMNSAVQEALSYLISMGYGDIQQLCDFGVFKQALRQMDLEECESTWGRMDGESIPEFINKCLVANMEGIVKERLIGDGLDEDEVNDTYLYWGESPRIFDSFSYEWRGPLADKAKKAFEEE